MRTSTVFQTVAVHQVQLLLFVALLTVGLMLAQSVATASSPVVNVALGMPALDAAAGNNPVAHCLVRADYCGDGA